MSIDLVHLVIGNWIRMKDFLKGWIWPNKTNQISNQGNVRIYKEGEDLGQNAILTKCLLIRKMESQQLPINTAATRCHAPECFSEEKTHFITWGNFLKIWVEGWKCRWRNLLMKSWSLASYSCKIQITGDFLLPKKVPMKRRRLFTGVQLFIRK